MSKARKPATKTTKAPARPSVRPPATRPAAPGPDDKPIEHGHPSVLNGGHINDNGQWVGP